ncbi:MAG: WG repeat-containing protein [Oscillospiraceae bacterium]
MKKTAKILPFLMAVLVLLAACGETPGFGESESGQESLQSSENGLSEPVQEEISEKLPNGIYKDENGKYGMIDGEANIIVEPIYKKALAYDNVAVFIAEDNTSVIINYSGETVGQYDRVVKETVGSETFFHACNIDGTRKELNIADDGALSLVDVENTICFPLDEFGNPILEETFDNLIFTFNNIDEKLPCIAAVQSGRYYEYVRNENGWELVKKSPCGETGFEFFGYKEIQYHWNIGKVGYGLIDAEGSTVFEPIYARVRMFFEDRVIIYEGSPYDFQTGESICNLITLDGEKLAKFANIDYTFFEDGSYVGIANATERAGNFAPGDSVSYGNYFIDKDGNIISELFINLNFRKEGDKFDKTYPDGPNDTFTAVTESGETVTLSVSDYICEP